MIDCVQSVRKQVGEVVIIDDGDSSDNVDKLHAWFSGIDGITIYHQAGNLGIAAALNRGGEIARAKGYQWLLTMDDDSLPEDDMVERLCRHARRLLSTEKIGAIGMSWKSQPRTAARPGRRCWREKRGIITSGCLFPLEAYDAVGRFREEFFIDGVDYDFCLRLRRHEHRVVQVLEYGFALSLGEREEHRLCGFVIHTYRHSPQRLYYQFRNATVLAVEYLWIDPLYVCAVAKSLVGTLAAVVAWQPQKRLRIKALTLGFSDALRGRMGRRILRDAGGTN